MVDPDSAPERRRGPTTVVALVLAVVSLVLVAPAATAVCSTLPHWGASANGSGATDAGYITVTGCSRRALVLTWECHGTFRVDDPYDGPEIERRVRVPNDFVRHATGVQLGVALFRPTRTAYYWDFKYAAEMAIATVGAILCIGGAVGILLSRRRRAEQLSTWTAAIGVLLVLPLVLTVVGLIHTSARVNDDGPPSDRPSTSSTTSAAPR